jgi:hypothetical protein
MRVFLGLPVNPVILVILVILVMFDRFISLVLLEECLERGKECWRALPIGTAFS